MTSESAGLSYKSAGVDIDIADAAKKDMAAALEPKDPRVLNRLGAFASLFQGNFPGYREPVLVLKMEEPGSKQKLALERGQCASICFDMINHLINDIAVMGALPLAVQDAIICGKLEKDKVNSMVLAMAAACRAQGCSLVGGETSEQPGVLPQGTYILSASVVGVVEKSKIVDGSQVKAGDVVVAIASNGLHTNGYSLVRALLEANPELANRIVDGATFLETILTPHLCYLPGLREIFDLNGLHGMAHITGGGIAGNLNRIIPAGLGAAIELSRIQVLPIFRVIRAEGQLSDSEMLKTFNLGVGLMLVCSPEAAIEACASLELSGFSAYQVGEIKTGSEKITFTGQLRWE